MSDPVFRAMVEKQRADRGNVQDTFCVQCHSALGVRSGEIQPGFAFTDLSPVTLEGVTCEACHRTVALERPFNSGHVLDLGAPIQGPFVDAASPHTSQASPLLGSAAFCGGCHDVTMPNGLSLESPFREWTTSKAQAEGRPCQSCHMPTYSGRAASLAQAPHRETLHSHAFVGVEPHLTPDETPETIAEAWAQSAQLLRSSATLELQSVVRAGNQLTVELAVNNQIDGHDFPTGSTFNRQFWVLLEVVDANGKPIYTSGDLDPSGDIRDSVGADGLPAAPALAQLGARLVDAIGTEVLYPWRATGMVRRTIPPLGREPIVYSVDLGENVELPLQVRARLRFRAYAPRLLRDLGLEDRAAELRVLDIAETATTVVARDP
jgi:hypothetical protein